MTSLATTSVNMLWTIIDITFEANALNEDMLIYIMGRFTALSSWLPYQKMLMDMNLDKCVDFGNLNGVLPFNLTMLTNFFWPIRF